jgi:hypothetical protein
MMYALFAAARTPLLCGNYAAANALTDELIALADDKGTLFWKASGMIFRGCILALTDQSSDAIYWLTSGLTAWQSTGAVVWRHDYLSYLAGAWPLPRIIGFPSTTFGLTSMPILHRRAFG